jgi:hypothetical protein
VSGGLNGNLGTKIVFYSNDLINPSYGFGLQGGRLVAFTDAGGAFSVRTSIGGADVVRLNNDGNISGRYIDSIANSGSYLDMGVGSSGILVMNRNTGHVPIAIRAAASQSSSLTEWQNSAGTALAKINQVGSAIFGDASQNAVGHINAFSADASSIPLVLQEYSLGGQTADLTQWRNAGATVIAKVDVSGRITAQSFIPSSSTVPTNGMYLSATNTVNFASNTTNRLAIDANGSSKFFSQILESATVSATAAATTVTYDVITNKNVLYYTSNATANWTFNVRGNSGTTLNSLMDTGQSLTVVFMNTNGATPYYPTAFQVDGTGVTPKWAGGAAPTAGNANSIDVYTYTIIKTGSAAYTVLASQSKFA